MPVKDDLRSASTGPGGQCVITSLMSWMPVWHVTNWRDSREMASAPILYHKIMLHVAIFEMTLACNSS